MGHDEQWMQYALSLAKRGSGRTAENPSVGCVIVQGEQVVGCGWTDTGGRPHAEARALLSAGKKAKGATAYVTLEPCAHYGRTPPCTVALYEAGIARVVIGCGDNDPRVAGQGIAQLRSHGIEVTFGVCEAAARAHHQGFLRRNQQHFPEISVKIATSADEKITTGTDNPWITGTDARAYGQLLRSTHQAIVTGIGTVLADNPLLTCRLQGLERYSPLRVVLDRELRIPLSAQLVTTAHTIPTIIFTSHKDDEKAQLLLHAGVDIALLPEGFSFADAMQNVAARGVQSVIVEGGAQLTHAALASGITDHLYWFIAPHLTIGKAGLPALSHDTLHGYAEQMRLQASLSLGQDMLHIYTGEINCRPTE